MKIKEVNIIIEPKEKFDTKITSKLKSIDRKRYSKEARTNVSFESINEVRKVLTKKRLELLRFIRHKKPASIYELAKKIDRDRKSVTTDINILYNLGFVELKEEKKIREIVKPLVNFDKIRIRVPI